MVSLYTSEAKNPVSSLPIHKAECLNSSRMTLKTWGCCGKLLVFRLCGKTKDTRFLQHQTVTAAAMGPIYSPARNDGRQHYFALNFISGLPEEHNVTPGEGLLTSLIFPGNAFTDPPKGESINCYQIQSCC